MRRYVSQSFCPSSAAPVMHACNGEPLLTSSAVIPVLLVHSALRNVEQKEISTLLRIFLFDHISRPCNGAGMSSRTTAQTAREVNCTVEMEVGRICREAGVGWDDYWEMRTGGSGMDVWVMERRRNTVVLILLNTAAECDAAEPHSAI